MFSWPEMLSIAGSALLGVLLGLGAFAWGEWRRRKALWRAVTEPWEPEPREEA